jgi:periplasmic protein CpxP/Spy
MASLLRARDIKRYTTKPRRKDGNAAHGHDDGVNHYRATCPKDFVMKTWIKRTLIGVFGASILVGGMAACSHRHHGWGGSHWSAEDSAKWRERILDRAGKELQLDDAQKQRLGVVVDKLREQRNALVAANADPRAELQSLVAGERFDKARAQALVDDKTGAIRGKAPETIAALAEFYDSLKPEQQQKVREFMARRGHGGWRS